MCSCACVIVSMCMYMCMYVCMNVCMHAGWCTALWKLAHVDYKMWNAAFLLMYIFIAP